MQKGQKRAKRSKKVENGCFLGFLKRKCRKRVYFQGSRITIGRGVLRLLGPGEGGWTSDNANYWPAEIKVRAKTQNCIKSISRVGVYS